MNAQNDYLEIGCGRTVKEAKERADAWLAEHGLGVASVGEENLVIDIGRDLDGHDFARCRVRRSALPAE